MYIPIPITTQTTPSSLPSSCVTIMATHIALVASNPSSGKRGSSSTPVFLLKRSANGTLKGLNLGLSVLRVTIRLDRKSTRLNSSHDQISYAVFCLKKKEENRIRPSHVR